jgi:hypothetical protein
MKKHHWHVFQHEKLFEKQPQPYYQIYLKTMLAWWLGQGGCGRNWLSNLLKHQCVVWSGLSHNVTSKIIVVVI